MDAMRKRGTCTGRVERHPGVCVASRAPWLLRVLALFWLLAPVVAGAQYTIGERALERGDFAEAWLILTPLAKAGDPRAQHDIGVMHALGLGVPESLEQAAHWLGRAAAQGHARSQARLGWMYYRGLGVTRDPGRAADWSRRAAEQGDAWAQGNYGYLLDTGEGVAQDPAAAALWYRRSAEQGNPEAQRNLGSLYEKGDGVARDLVQAFAWYGVASVSGDGQAIRMRDALAVGLDADALERGRALARELFRRHGSDPGIGR